MEFTMNTHGNENEIAEVHSSLTIVDDVIHCKRIQNPTPFQIQYSIQKAIEMAHKEDLHKYLIDARATLPPSAQLRQVLRKFLNCFVGHFDSMVVVLDENPTLQVTTQFIFHNHEVPDNMHFHICKTIEQGLEFLEQH
jgi:hypothetical protein